MGEKNRQHYVPKFYLRHFSETEKSINTFNIGNSKYISNASIRGMCQKNNFYGADNRIETFLDKEIESKASITINNILNTNKLPRDEDFVHFVMFVIVSEARNLKRADSSDHMANYISKSLMSENPECKDIDLDSFEVKVNEPANYNIEIAMRSTPLVLDLKPLLIIEQTGARKFITSDNPVVRYNSFYLSKGYRGGFGYINRGLQFFFPISPQKCILLYDQFAYDIPNAENNVLILKRASDVDKLNELFYLNAYNNVFFNQKTRQSYIEGIHNKHKKTPKVNELEREISTFQSVDSNNTLISFGTNHVSKKINFSWIKTSEFANKLIIPSHMGGINREEWPPIQEFLEKKRIEFEEDQYPVARRMYRSKN
ncbi:DUF4238 domain-containing protein [Bacillus sp. LK2]|uniref:DUF4238 domain-containing protein n=1 Tax=Bacillus sp. LK2 TaxID=1628206 RepID=UPI000652F7DB|nr:DUF4238 domain-containing protein [Bacillus sp. LK2]KMN42307.1 hypothetical protein VK90_24865 [Bacillus sp. LK2]